MNMRRWMLVPLVLVLASPLFALDDGAVDEDEQAEKLKAADRDRAFLLRVNEAVRKGMEWLLDQQEADGSFPCSYSDKWPGGSTALSLLALLKSGVPRSHDAIQKGFEFLRRRPLQKTYTAGITLMALEALYMPQKPEDRQKGHTRAVRPGRVKMPRKDLDWMRELVAFLIENMVYSKVVTQNGVITTPKNAWSYPEHNQGDHSNTQYAILGLRAAQRSGVRIPRAAWEDVWTKVLDHFLDVQEADGPQVMRWVMHEDSEHGYVTYKSVSRVPDKARGWTYTAGIEAKPGGKVHSDATTGSMTCVGIASLVIAMDGLAQIRSPKLSASRKREVINAVHDGLAWMAHHFTVTTNPGHPSGDWLYYYLYGMERAAVLSGVRNIGQHDWYREGAEFLMSHQRGGSWSSRQTGAIPGTCFALLFLTKATVPGLVKITR